MVRIIDCEPSPSSFQARQVKFSAYLRVIFEIERTDSSSVFKTLISLPGEVITGFRLINHSSFDLELAEQTMVTFAPKAMELLRINSDTFGRLADKFCGQKIKNIKDKYKKNDILD